MQNNNNKFYFDENSTAMLILKNRDLTGQYAIVVGANRGVGKFFRFGYRKTAIIDFILN